MFSISNNSERFLKINWILGVEWHWRTHEAATLHSLPPVWQHTVVACNPGFKDMTNNKMDMG